MRKQILVGLIILLPSVCFSIGATQDEFSEAFEDALNRSYCSNVTNPNMVHMVLDNNVQLSVSVDHQHQKVVAKSVTQKFMLTINLDFTLQGDGTLIIDKPIVGEDMLTCTDKDVAECIAQTQKGLDYLGKHFVQEATDQKEDAFQCLLVVLNEVRSVLQ